jgi:Protein of unknown function (DUF2799)
MNYKIIFLAAFIFLLNGCATMDKSECLNADWKIIGMEDGAEGRLPAYLGEHRTACAAHNIKPNLNTYLMGHEIGVRQYCTAPNGYNAGKQGDEYNGICPPELETNFLDAFQHGHEHYLLQSEIDDVEYSIRYNKSEIEDLEEEISELETQIISNKTAEAQRSTLLDTVKKSQNKIGNLEKENVKHIENKAILSEKLKTHNQKHKKFII